MLGVSYIGKRWDRQGFPSPAPDTVDVKKSDWILGDRNNNSRKEWEALTSWHPPLARLITYLSPYTQLPWAPSPTRLTTLWFVVERSPVQCLQGCVHPCRFGGNVGNTDTLAENASVQTECNTTSTMISTNELSVTTKTEETQGEFKEKKKKRKTDGNQ